MIHVFRPILTPLDPCVGVGGTALKEVTSKVPAFLMECDYSLL